MSRRAGPEASVQQSVVAYAEARGCLVIRVNSGLTILKNPDGSRRAIKLADEGTSDLLLCVPAEREQAEVGLFLAVEVKVDADPRLGRKRTVPTEAQRDFLASVRRSGGWGEVVRSVADLKTILDDLGCPAIGAGGRP